RWRRLLEIDEDSRLPGRCVAADGIEMVRFVELALEALGDLQQHFLNRRAGPGRGDDHRPEREYRVLAAAQSQERQRACDHGDDHQEDDQRASAERPLGKIGTDHCLVSSKRTFWPGRSACTPAVTTTSPGLSPDRTATLAESWDATSMLRVDTVPVLGSTIHTADCRSDRITAEGGISMPCVLPSCMRPVPAVPGPIAAGGLATPTLILKVPVAGSAGGETSLTRPAAVTFGSAVTKTVISGLAGAASLSRAGTSKTASRPPALSTCTIMRPACPPSPGSAPPPLTLPPPSAPQCAHPTPAL